VLSVVSLFTTIALEGGVFENVPQSRGDTTVKRTKTNGARLLTADHRKLEVV
jgi:hypothetical protein